MNFYKILLFILGLILGYTCVCLFADPTRIVVIYPNPDNILNIQYKTKNSKCYQYKVNKVKCPIIGAKQIPSE